jgi:Icc protein
MQIVELSDCWTMVLLNSRWAGHDAGYVSDAILDLLCEHLARSTKHVVLGVHHPPVSPCDQDACTMVGSDRLLGAIRGTRVRAVLSGHVHSIFETSRDGITFLGAPSTFRQLRHGGEPHYTDTGEDPAAQSVELRDDGSVVCRIVTARPGPN